MQRTSAKNTKNTKNTEWKIKFSGALRALRWKLDLFAQLSSYYLYFSSTHTTGTPMTTHQLQADYLIVGSGAVGMAFADSIFHESEATMVIVDRHHGPGGHWNDAYPFVRLHQPSSFYGVNSRKLGHNGLDTDPLNPGMTERATSAEILAYYEALMQDMLASGRVVYLPMTHYVGPWASGAPAGIDNNDSKLVSYAVSSLLCGVLTQVKVARKVVDTSYLNTAVPSTHPPKYAVAPGIECMPLNNLPKVKSCPSGYVVVGAGKTGIDACLWLLANQVPPDQIRWIMPRDSWFQNRASVQSGEAFFMSTFTAMALQYEAVANANSVAEVFVRLEADNQLLRLDKNVEPTMYHAAVVSLDELHALRQIKDIVRMGRVVRFEKEQIVLERGNAPMNAGRIVVDCSASAAEMRPAMAVFQSRVITPQFIQAFQPTFSAALIAHVELRYDDEAVKNKICTPVPLPDTPLTWLTMQAATLANRYVWGRDKGIAQWLVDSRLDGFSKMMHDVQEHEADKIAVMQRLGAAIVPAVGKLKTLLATQMSQV